MIRSALTMVAIAAAMPATAQVTMAQPSGQAVLRTGTPISLRVLQGITTKNKVARINDRVRMEVAENVTVNDIVVIPAGSPAVGELTEVRNKGMWGKSGRLVARALTVNANGRTIRLSGTFDNKGGSGTGGAVAVSALVFLPAGFFMTGKSAEMPTGMVVKAFIDEDVPVAFGSNTPRTTAPMVVK
jgi:hypothetical protein